MIKNEQQYRKFKEQSEEFKKVRPDQILKQEIVYLKEQYQDILVKPKEIQHEYQPKVPEMFFQEQGKLCHPDVHDKFRD